MTNENTPYDKRVFRRTTTLDVSSLRGISEIATLDFPILIGASRKRFLGEELPPEEREAASIAVTSFCVRRGCGAHMWSIS